MKKSSNIYTILYAAVLVIIVGFVLSVIYQALRPTQVENIANDTRKQILAAARLVPQKGQSIADLYKEHITDSYIVNFRGARIDPNLDPFDIDISAQVKLPEDKRKLPVFECQTPDGLKYILPVYGAGLWGPIWGYIAFDDNGDTIYGAYFGHQGETPGLGAEIEKPAFQDQFQGKEIFNSADQFQSVQVAKVGQEPADVAYVHAISGGTITSQGVQKMLYNSLSAYSDFLLKLKSENGAKTPETR